MSQAEICPVMAGRARCFLSGLDKPEFGRRHTLSLPAVSAERADLHVEMSGTNVKNIVLKSSAMLDPFSSLRP